jgi:hypothetical protein
LSLFLIFNKFQKIDHLSSFSLFFDCISSGGSSPRDVPGGGGRGGRAGRGGRSRLGSSPHHFDPTDDIGMHGPLKKVLDHTTLFHLL